METVHSKAGQDYQEEGLTEGVTARTKPQRNMEWGGGGGPFSLHLGCSRLVRLRGCGERPVFYSGDTEKPLEILSREMTCLDGFLGNSTKSPFILF